MSSVVWKLEFTFMPHFHDIIQFAASVYVIEKISYIISQKFK